MNSERRLLVGKRRGDSHNNSTACVYKSVTTVQNNTSYVSTSPRATAQPSRNIASDRMKRLRESLLDDLNNKSSNVSDTPPSKKFIQAIGSTQAQPPILNQKVKSKLSPNKKPAELRYKTDISSRLSKNIGHDSNATISSPKTRSPIKKEAKKYSHYNTSTINKSHTSSRLSINSRLTAAASSPSVFKHQNVFSNNQIQNSFSTFSTPSGSNTFEVLDTDVNIVDVSGGNNSFTLNSGDISESFNVSSTCQPNNSTQDDFEDMDWSPVSEETLISNIRQYREMVQDEHSQRLFNTENIKTSSRLNLNPENIYIIVDTNIFIDKLQTITNIMNITYSDSSYPVIYLPWMVIQELDYFKDGYSLSDKHPISKVIQTKCRKAVNFINSCLIARKPNFKGQSVQEAAQNHNKSQSPDDSILSCCVQLKNLGYEVILLSSDTNLRNKAILSDVNSFPPIDIIKQLTSIKPISKNRNFVEELCKKLSLICTFVLHFEIKAYYGEKLYEKLKFKPVPWQFQDCIKYLHKHYESVFQPNVQKQCRKVVVDLKELFESNEDIINEVKFMEMCLSLLIYLQTGLPKYESNIQNTIKEIKDLENDFLH